MKILATSDWHLGSRPGPVVNGKNTRAENTLACVDELIARAAELQPDAILFAGDLFDVARTWSSRGLPEVQEAIQRIEKLASIAPVALMRGTPNHDSAEAFELLKTYFGEHDEAGVLVITEPGLYRFFTKDGRRINLCALPGFDRGYWRSQNPGVDRIAENEAFTESLEKMIYGMRAMCSEDAPNVLMGHYTVEGANTESGQLMMFSQFEPVISQRTLVTADYDLCCFGHIHRPQELGNKAFYAGGVNRFNFNDEHQPRGFYVHTLEYHELINSEFIELSSPVPFETIRLDDADITLFNTSGMMILGRQDIHNAIVRVLYECTDENHKALNRAAMERYLLDAGAYWVQEITPTVISATVNRNELDGDSSPEQNLREYLDEKITAGAVTENEAQQAFTRGCEIIHQALAGNALDHANGLFAPLEISVTNYRNYREETFSFEDVRFATINGMNGVGKSSLFMDAIYDALFEDPREGDLVGWINNDPDVRSGSIVFTFRVGDTRWRVSRTRVKSGKATLNLSEFVDGQWADRSEEKMRDTQSAIERVIGLDGQTLRACALIMQDQYGLFLQAGKEERMQILSDILGLGIYDDMASIAADKATETNRKLREMHYQHEELSKRASGIDKARAEHAQISADIAEYDARLESLNKDLQTQRDEATRLDLRAEANAMYRNQVNDLAEDIREMSEKAETAMREAEQYEATLANQQAILDGAEMYRKAIARRDELQEAMNDHKALVTRADHLRDAAQKIKVSISGRISSPETRITPRVSWSAASAESARNLSVLPHSTHGFRLVAGASNASTRPKKCARSRAAESPGWPASRHTASSGTALRLHRSRRQNGGRRTQRPGRWQRPMSGTSARGVGAT